MKKTMTKAQAKKKLKRVAKLNGRPQSDFRVVEVIYSNGKIGWDVTAK